MDDQSQHEQPLFHNTDEQERVYAPQQVPGALPTSADDDATTGLASTGPIPTAVPPAAPTSTTAPELTLSAPVDLAARSLNADDGQRDQSDR